MRSHGIVSVILAAGESKRMGSPKPLLPLDRSNFLQTIINHHLGIDSDLIVVLGSEHSRIARAIDFAQARVVINPEPEKGSLSSLKLALDHVNPLQGVLVHPVDHPLVQPSTLHTLLKTHFQAPECILIPEFRGRKGHPVLFPTRFRKDLIEAPLSQGARWVVRRSQASLHRVAVDDPGIHQNIDTPEQYREIAGHPVLNKPPQPTE